MFDEGRKVMYEVTVQLYPGNIPPRSFLKNDYFKFFDSDQRATLESWKENGFFEISSLAKQFDISLHFAVQKHVCKIWEQKSLFKNVKALTEKRNKVAHSVDLFEAFESLLQPSSNVENEELDNVLQLCLDILEDLEECTGSSQIVTKHEIQNSIERKKYSVNQIGSQVKPYSFATHQPCNKDYGQVYMPKPRDTSFQKEETSDTSAFGKVAIGVGVAAAVGIGIGALIKSFSSEKEKEKEKK